jgi:GNAT superfamily N-acetyltransferase
VPRGYACPVMTVDQSAARRRHRPAEVEIRPIRPEDKAAFVEAFERLSERSRYRRFLAPHGSLTNAELRYLIDVDHHDHEALVALEAATQGGIGVARYVRSHVTVGSAEVAVAVVDDWQGQGVGGRLAAALADRAREEGITSFTALMLAENTAVRRLLGDIGRVRDVQSDAGTVELTVDLPEQGLGHVSRLLGPVARAELTALRHPSCGCRDARLEHP